MTGFWLRARIYSNVQTVLNGPGSGRMLVEVTGRRPMWSRSLRGYVTSERVAGDVIALADRAGTRVEVRDYREAALIDINPSTGEPRANPDAVEPAQLDLGLEAAP